MNAFLVDLENKPGTLARVTEAIAKKGVNLTSASGTQCDSGGRLAITTDNDAATRTALGEIKATFSEKEIVEASLRHEAGSLAKAARRLADAGVNIEAIAPMGMKGNDITVGFITDNPAKARSALQEVAASR
jgi:hypothetical protein